MSRPPLSAAAAIGKGLQLRAGVNNLLDKNPPALAASVLSAFGNGNTYPGVYDTLGRTMFAARRSISDPDAPRHAGDGHGAGQRM